MMKTNAKIHTKSHYLRPHSGDNPGNELCCIYYVGENWQPDYGGRLELFSDGEKIRTIDPIGNRMIVFRPSAPYLHDVEPLN